MDDSSNRVGREARYGSQTVIPVQGTRYAFITAFILCNAQAYAREEGFVCLAEPPTDLPVTTFPVILLQKGPDEMRSSWWERKAGQTNFTQVPAHLAHLGWWAYVRYLIMAPE